MKSFTRDQRIRAYYQTLAGPWPGPNTAAIAAILAHQIVELEDKQPKGQLTHGDS